MGQSSRGAPTTVSSAMRSSGAWGPWFSWYGKKNGDRAVEGEFRPAVVGDLRGEEERDMDMTPSRLQLPPVRDLPRDGDCFAVLGVNPEASQHEIQRAYFNLARRFHPDLNQSPNARNNFIILQKAYAEATSADGMLVKLAKECRGVRGKKNLAGILRGIEFVEKHTGMKLEDIVPRSPLAGTGNSEEHQAAQEAGWIIALKCPICKHRKTCDQATGFAEVYDMHRRMQRLMAKRALASLFGGLRRNTLSQK